MKFAPKNDLPILTEGLPMFYPHVPRNAVKYVTEVLSTRWIGQGPKVDEFERRFKQQVGLVGDCVAVGSGTDALHLAYILAGIGPGDEVLTPLFTCTATNLPLLYIGAKPVFVDVDPHTLNVSVEDMRSKITGRTKAIVVVHYGGLPCDMNEILTLADEHGLMVIEDCAHALGATYDGIPAGDLADFGMFSFQAIKHLTTGDGGMLTVPKPYTAKAKRLRWFGIDREKKQGGIWENDITEIGYKYQMTDIQAAIGLAGLEELEATQAHRRKLYGRYTDHLEGIIPIVDDADPLKEHACWLFTVLAEDREGLQRKLRERGIESGQTHYRNDRYTVFNESGHFPNMDSVDDKYLILPLHTRMTLDDVDRVCEVIKEGW